MTFYNLFLQLKKNVGGRKIFTALMETAQNVQLLVFLRLCLKISFCSCRNVTIDPSPHDRSQQLNKKLDRQGVNDCKGIETHFLIINFNDFLIENFN